MSIQCQTASAHPDTHSRLSRLYSVLADRFDAWSQERRRKNSLRILEALPDHVLHDIGWPDINDRLPAYPRTNQKS